MILCGEEGKGTPNSISKSEDIGGHFRGSQEYCFDRKARRIEGTLEKENTSLSPRGEKNF